ncbi:MAG: hypothetical protein K6F49_06010 [Saccharofermentans sp.]|nr:hypothetical protein [Saccharofermentans sp.]
MDMITPDENIRETVADRLKGKWILELIFAILYILAHLLAWIIVLCIRQRSELLTVRLVAITSVLIWITLLSLSAVVLKRVEADKSMFQFKYFINVCFCAFSGFFMCMYPYIFMALIATVSAAGTYLWLRCHEFRRYLAILKGEYKVSDACVIFNELKCHGGYKHSRYINVTRVDRRFSGFDVYVDLVKVDALYDNRHSWLTFHYLVQTDSDQSVYEIQTDRKTFNDHLIGYRGKVTIFDSDDLGEKAMML